MRTIKLTKKHLKMIPSDFILAISAVSKDGKHAFPNHVYLSKEDYKTFRKNTEKAAKKLLKNRSDKSRILAVEYEILQFGANSMLEDAIKPGWVVIDVSAIEKEELRSVESK